LWFIKKTINTSIDSIDQKQNNKDF
jgi:hypothetical protein